MSTTSPSYPTHLKAPKVIEVAVAVFARRLIAESSAQLPADEVLLALRPSGKLYARYWEFPGGKIEVGESAEQALVREIQEELGVDVQQPQFVFNHEHRYAHGRVCLNFFIVRMWRGDFVLKEHDGIAWQNIQAINLTPLLPANHNIVPTIARHLNQA